MVCWVTPKRWARVVCGGENRWYSTVIAARSSRCEAVPLPIAISSTWCVRASRASVPSPSSQRRCGWCGWIVWVATTLPVASTTATLTPRAEARVEAHGRARAGGSGQQQIAEVGGEYPHRLVLGRLPEAGTQVEGEVHQDARAP